MNQEPQSYFSAWADLVRDMVPDLCGQTCDRVPVWYLEALYREGCSTERAAPILAAAISP